MKFNFLPSFCRIETSKLSSAQTLSRAAGTLQILREWHGLYPFVILHLNFMVLVIKIQRGSKIKQFLEYHHPVTMSLVSRGRST